MIVYTGISFEALEFVCQGWNKLRIFMCISVTSFYLVFNNFVNFPWYSVCIIPIKKRIYIPYISQIICWTLEFFRFSHAHICFSICCLIALQFIFGFIWFYSQNNFQSELYLWSSWPHYISLVSKSWIMQGMKLLSHALPNLSFNYVRVMYMLVILNLIDSLITCSFQIF